MTKIPDWLYRQAAIEQGERYKKQAKLIHDVTPPKDDWERGYAHLAFLHTKLKMVATKKIEVKYV